MTAKERTKTDRPRIWLAEQEEGVWRFKFKGKDGKLSGSVLVSAAPPEEKQTAGEKMAEVQDKLKKLAAAFYDKAKELE